MRRRFSRFGWAVLFALTLSACEPLIASYSPTAYKNATDLKATTLFLVAKSGDPFSAHASEVEALKLDVDKAYEYAAGLRNNQISPSNGSSCGTPMAICWGPF